MTDTKKTSGRPSAYTKEIKEEICTRLSLGESLRSICLSENIPVMSTVLLWVVNNREGFSEHYNEARRAQAYTHVDEMLDMREGILDGSIEPNAARVVADIIKWTTTRMNKKAFGDRQEIEQTTEVTHNIMTVPTAASAEEWEQVSQEVHDKNLNDH